MNRAANDEVFPKYYNSQAPLRETQAFLLANYVSADCCTVRYHSYLLPKHGKFQPPVFHTLSQVYVGDGTINVVSGRVASMYHQSVHKLHGLCPLTPQLARHDHLASLRTTLHDESQYSITGSAHTDTRVKHGYVYWHTEL